MLYSAFTSEYIPKTRIFKVSTKWCDNFFLENDYQLEVDLNKGNKFGYEHFLIRSR